MSRNCSVSCRASKQGWQRHAHKSLLGSAGRMAGHPGLAQAGACPLGNTQEAATSAKTRRAAPYGNQTSSHHALPLPSKARANARTLTHTHTCAHTYTLSSTHGPLKGPSVAFAPTHVRMKVEPSSLPTRSPLPGDNVAVGTPGHHQDKSRAAQAVLFSVFTESVYYC